MANHDTKFETYCWMSGNNKIGNFTIEMNKKSKFNYFIDDKDVTDWVRVRLPGKLKTKKLNEQFFLQTEYSEYYYLKHTNCFANHDDLWVKFDSKLKYEQVVLKNQIIGQLLEIYKNGFDIDSPRELTEEIMKETVQKEVQRQRDKGISIRTMDSKGVYDLNPDGSKNYINEFNDNKQE